MKMQTAPHNAGPFLLSGGSVAARRLHDVLVHIIADVTRAVADKTAILHVARAFAVITPLPWLTTAFCDAYDRYLNFEVKSLDELFGGRRKGMQIGAARRRLEKRDEVFWRVQELRKAGRSVNRDLFNAVGKEFGISGAKADSFYYEVVAARKKLGIAQD